MTNTELPLPSSDDIQFEQANHLLPDMYQGLVSQHSSYHTEKDEIIFQAPDSINKSFSQSQPTENQLVTPRVQSPRTGFNINAKEFKPNVKKTKQLFKLSYHPENNEAKEVNCLNDVRSGFFTNESASTCFDAQSLGMSNLMLTVRNSTKSTS